MRILLLVVVSFLFFSFGSSGQSRDIETIKKLNEDFLNSIRNRDSTELSKILADDFILIAPNGSKMNKHDNLLNLHSRNFEINSVNIDSVEVRLLTSDVGILSGWTTFVFKADGKASTGKNCYQDIYMKRKNKWVAVSAHVTLLNNR